jgi:uncharacterized membrane-anchored protein YitT (DUF2179 family)
MIAPFKTPIFQNIKKKGPLREYLVLLLGSAIVATGYVFFVTPYKIIPGGVYGISIIIHYLSQGVFSWFPDGLPIGATALVFNIPLWFAAFRLLGKTYGPKTIVTFISTAVFTDLLTFLNGGTETQIVPNDLLLASIYGGALIGVGVAFIFKASATSAGTDVIARIVSKYRNSKIGTPIIIVDSIIVFIGLIAFHSWEVPLYSWITIFVYGRVVDAIMKSDFLSAK